MKYPDLIWRSMCFVTCRNAQNMKVIIILAGLMLLSLSYLWGDEGRIPIYRITTISQSGHYILTRDISVTTNTQVINISAPNVTLDLNGKTISSASTTVGVINLDINISNATIRNGYLNGGYSGIQYNGGAVVPPRIFLENLTIRNTANNGIVLIDVAHAEVIACKIFSAGYSGIYVTNETAAFTGKVNNNTINGVQADGIYIDNIRSGEIRNNTIQNFGINPGSGYGGIGVAALPGINAEGNLIKGNTISAGLNNNYGIWLMGYSDNNLIIDNGIASTGGIRLASSNNLLFGNVINANSLNGIYVEGARNLIDSNQIIDNGGYGINFDSPSSNNSYRKNMIRGNTSGTVIDNGTSNTNDGGNII